ncbi:MAG TPA: hypothetical protein VII52_06920 [Gemmatimonadaceae bacterium]
MKRIPYERALCADTTHRHDFLNTYVRDLGTVVDMEWDGKIRTDPSSAYAMQRLIDLKDTFVDGLGDGALDFCGEESVGASFLRRDGTVWTTDKDGIAPGAKQ